MSRAARNGDEWLGELWELYSRWARHDHDVVAVFVSAQRARVVLKIVILNHSLILNLLLKVPEGFACLAKHEQLSVLLKVLESEVFDVA